ncbi:MAG: WD40 repeat domain-containing protein [Planctomycetota bacterium]
MPTERPEPPEPPSEVPRRLTGLGPVEILLGAPGGHLALVREVAVDAERGLVLSGEHDGAIYLSRLADGSVVDVWARPSWVGVEGLGFTPDGVGLALTRGGQLVQVRERQDPTSWDSGHSSGMDLDVDPSGWVATAGKDGVRLWSAAGVLAQASPPPLICSGSVQVARFQPSGQRGVALGPQGCWRFDVDGAATPAPELPAGGYEDLAFSPAGDLLATLDNRSRVRLYTWPSLELLAERVIYERPPQVPGFYNARSVCFREDGRALYTGDPRPSVTTWSVPELERQSDWHPGWRSWVEQIRRLPDATLLVSGNSRTATRFTPGGEPLWRQPVQPYSYLGEDRRGERAMRMTTSGLHWLSTSRLALNSESGLTVVDLDTGRWRSEPKDHKEIGGERLSFAADRFYMVRGGTLVAGRLTFDEHSVRAQDPRAREGNFVDVAVYEGSVLAVDRIPGGARLIEFDAAMTPRATWELSTLGDWPRLADRWGEVDSFGVYGQARLRRSKLEGAALTTLYEVALAHPDLPQGPAYCAVGGDGLLVVYPGEVRYATPDGVNRVRRLPRELQGEVCARGIEGGVAIGGWGGVLVLRSDASEDPHVGFVSLRHDRVADLVASADGDALFVWTTRGYLLKVALLRE